MIHAFPVLEDLPLFHLKKDDIILVEPGDPEPVGVYRPLPRCYASILGTLIEQGAVSSSLTYDDLASVARLSPPVPGAALVPRSGVDRRREHLKLMAASE